MTILRVSGIALLVALSGACSADDSAENRGDDSGEDPQNPGGDGANDDNAGDNGDDFDDGGEDDGGDGGGDDGGFDLGGGDGEPPPPEDEQEGNFHVPRASGRFVYSAGENNDSVAVIDSSDLAIDVVEVGRGPTVVVPIPGTEAGAGRVAVLNPGSQELAFIHTDDAGRSTVELAPVTRGANNIEVTADGRYVVVYHDVDAPQDVVVAGTTQELAVVETGLGHRTWTMSVGTEPRDVLFSEDAQTIYVVTADGVNVIDLAALDEVGKPPIVPVALDPATDPDTLEVHVSAQRGQALARVDGETWLVVTDLATGVQTVVELAGYPTDLDLAADGSFALLVLPGGSASALVEVDLPPHPDGPRTDYVVGEYVGLAELAADASTVVLYTAQGEASRDAPKSETSVDPRLRVTVGRRVDGRWSDFTTIWAEVPVRATGMAPGDATAILVHESSAALNPKAPWPYTLLDLTQPVPVKKLQNAEVPPLSILFTPSGDRAVILLRDDDRGVQRVDYVDLNNFLVRAISLGSPPDGAGYVAATDKIFVSQDHPLGRITFIEPDGDIRTITGFELDDGVKD